MFEDAVLSAFAETCSWLIAVIVIAVASVVGTQCIETSRMVFQHEIKKAALHLEGQPYFFEMYFLMLL